MSTLDRMESYSNDVWCFDDVALGPVVLRVAWRGDVDRLEREAHVTESVPPSVRVPKVLGHGTTSLGEHRLGYTVTRRLEGGPLDAGWAALSDPQKRDAVTQVATMLRDLHRWRPPAPVAAVVRVRAELSGHVGITELLGADLNPLPIDRSVALAKHAATLPFVDPGLMADAIETLEGLRDLDPSVEDPTRHGLIHGDVQLSNLWRTATGELVLIDLEWVRFAPPLLDVQRLCQSADADVVTGSGEHPEILRWFVEDYPELGAGNRVRDRMRLYTLTFSIRHAIVAPTSPSDTDLPPDHVLYTIRRLVDDQWPEAGSLLENLLHR
jgi:hypothetical protein